MFELGKKMGKQTAHHVVYECAMQAYEQQRDFKETLRAHPQMDNSISDDELNRWLDPVNYLGSAPRKVDEVIAAAQASGLLEMRA